MKFILKAKKPGFTLIELMVVISIVGILALGITRMDFSRLSDKQKLDIFTNKIVSKIETVRNNALIGKGVGLNSETPDEWRIQVTTSSLTSDYSLASSWINDTQNSLSVVSPYTISNIECIRLDNGTGSISGTGIINIQRQDFTLSGCSNSTFKILEITTGFKSFTKAIRINTLSGLVEVD